MIPYSALKKVLYYTIIMFVIYLSTGGSWLANDKNLMIGGWLFFSIIYFYTENYIKPILISAIGIFLLISVFYFVKNGAYNQTTYLGFFIKMTLAYYCRDLCKEDFFEYFVHIVFVGACISFAMFTFQLVSYDTFYNFNNFFGAEYGVESRANSFVFTTLPLHSHRNCGFMWEPGAFAAVLVLTLYINLFKLEDNILSKKNLVFIFAILTTQSTMGFLSLLIPISLVMKDYMTGNRVVQQLSLFFLPIILIAFSVVFFNTPFLYSKMTEEITNVEEELAFVERGKRDKFLVSTTRTASIILDFKTIKNYPITGLGIDSRTTSADKLESGEFTVTACGLTTLLIRFGIIGFVFYTFLFYKNAFFTQTIHKIGWVFLIFFILFSNELSESAFIHLFVF